MLIKPKCNGSKCKTVYFILMFEWILYVCDEHYFNRIQTLDALIQLLRHILYTTVHNEYSKSSQIVIQLCLFKEKSKLNRQESFFYYFIHLEYFWNTIFVTLYLIEILIRSCIPIKSINKTCKLQVLEPAHPIYYSSGNALM